MRRLAPLLVLLALAVPAAAADVPRLESAIGTSRTTVRLTFAAPLGVAVDTGDFSLSMGDEPVQLASAQTSGDGATVVLRALRPWPYGTAGSVTFRDRTVRVWASPGDATPPVLRGVRLNHTVLCARGVSSNCNRSGGTVRYVVDEPVSIVLDLRRRLSDAPSVERFPKPAGRGTVTFNEKVEGRRLRPGGYILLVTAVDAAGNESRTFTLRLRVRR